MNYCIVFGCCTIDKTFFEKDNSHIESFGGKGGNQAIALSRAGVKTVMLSLLSKEKSELKTTKAHLKNLKKNKVCTKHIAFDPVHKNDFTNVTIALDGDNQLDEVIDISQAFDEEYVLKNKTLIENAKYVLLQMKVPVNVTKKVVEICKNAGVKTVLTPCRIEKTRANMDIIDSVDYITCNTREVKEIFGKDGKLPPTELNKVLKKYPNKLIATLGSKAVKYYDGKKIVTEPAIAVKDVKDTTGAGDTFCANLVACLFNGDNLSTAVKKGICASTIKIQTCGTQTGMPKAKDRDKLFAQKYKGENNND